MTGTARIALKDYFSNEVNQFNTSLECSYALHESNRTSGFYAVLEGNTLGLFTYGGKLFLLLNSVTFGVNELLSARFDASDDERRLTIENGSNKHVVRYNNSAVAVSTPFYSEDEEDADFGLWVSNVLMSDERKQRVNERWQLASP